MMLEKIAKIIANATNCQIDDVTPEVELETLGINSLKAITIIFELEETFDIEIPNEAITSIITVDDLMKKVKAEIQQA